MLINSVLHLEKMKFNSKIFYIIAVFSLLFSCSKKDEKTSAEIEYVKAMNLLKEKSYAEAATTFEKIDDDYPFSKWASKAQTMAVYARYKEEDYGKLIQITDDFLNLNPSSEYVSYMLYMKGLSYYNQIPAITRAQDDTQHSSFIFRELIARFPESDYSLDAKEKIAFVDEHLAGAKMSIGRYEIINQNYVGAISYFSEVIYRYRQTKQVPEAYFRLVEIYCKIGLKEEAKKAQRELNSKFPDNHWTKLSNLIDLKNS